MRSTRNFLFCRLNGHKFLSTRHPRSVIPHLKVSPSMLILHTRHSFRSRAPDSCPNPRDAPARRGLEAIPPPQPQSGRASLVPLPLLFFACAASPGSGPTQRSSSSSSSAAAGSPPATSTSGGFRLRSGSADAMALTSLPRAGRSASDVSAARTAGSGHGSNGRVGGRASPGRPAALRGTPALRHLSVGRQSRPLGPRGCFAGRVLASWLGRGEVHPWAVSGDVPPHVLPPLCCGDWRWGLPVSPLLRCCLYPTDILLPKLPSCLFHKPSVTFLSPPSPSARSWSLCAGSQDAFRLLNVCVRV